MPLLKFKLFKLIPNILPFLNSCLNNPPKILEPIVTLTLFKSSSICFLVFLIICFKSKENTPNKELCNPANI